MALSDQQIRELEIAQSRVNAGTASDADRRNLEFAISTYAPTDPRLQDFNVQAPTIPQGTRELPEMGSGGLTIGQAQTPAQAPQVPQSNYGQFGQQLMQLLQRQQQLGTKRFQEQEIGAQEAQIGRISEKTPEDLIGSSPAIQSAVRASSASALDPTISGARQAQQTFSEQINSLGSAINQAQGIAQWLQGIEQQTKNDARELIFNTPDAVRGLDEKQQAELEKKAGLPKGFIAEMPETIVNKTVRSQVVEVGNMKKLINLDTGETIKDLGISDVGGTTGGGTVGIGGSVVTPTGEVVNLSPLAQSIWDGTLNLKDITPTQRAVVAPELNKAGWTNVVANEQKSDFATTKSGIDSVLQAWKGVSGGKKGFVQGRVSIFLKAGEWNEKVATFNASVGIVGMQLTRLFEKGRISDADRDFYMGLMPNLRMNEESAIAGAEELKRRLDTKLQSNIGNVNSFISGSNTGSENNDPLGIL